MAMTGRPSEGATFYFAAAPGIRTDQLGPGPEDPGTTDPMADRIWAERTVGGRVESAEMIFANLRTALRNGDAAFGLRDPDLEPTGGLAYRILLVPKSATDPNANSVHVRLCRRPLRCQERKPSAMETASGRQDADVTLGAMLMASLPEEAEAIRNGLMGPTLGGPH